MLRNWFAVIPAMFIVINSASAQYQASTFAEGQPRTYAAPVAVAQYVPVSVANVPVVLSPNGGNVGVVPVIIGNQGASNAGVIAVQPGMNGMVGNAGMMVVPIATLGAPVAPVAQGCANGRCGQGSGGGRCGPREPTPLDWNRFYDWLCYRSLKGGCDQPGGCGCNCSVPLYAYYLKECKEGRGYELPACVKVPENKPSVFRHMFNDVVGVIGHAGVGGRCANGACAAPGTSNLPGGQPTGH